MKLKKFWSVGGRPPKSATEICAYFMQFVVFKYVEDSNNVFTCVFNLHGILLVNFEALIIRQNQLNSIKRHGQPLYSF